MSISVGGKMFQIISMVGSVNDLSSHYLAERSSGRLLEEVVELCLASRLAPGKLTMHVIDALHNEAKKEKSYPSQILSLHTDLDRMIELGDVKILLDLLRFLFGFTEEHLDRQVELKLQQLEKRARNGEMILIDGLMYRKESRL